MDTADGQIHYRVAGSGNPVLLLHQSPRSSDEYRDVMPILARTKRVIAFDILGYGDSDTPPRPYSIQEFAKTIPVILDALEVEKASLVGQHLGALIAAEAAASFPERTDKLVLVHAFEMNAKARRELVALRPWHMQPDGSHLAEMWEWAMARTTEPQVAHQFVIDLLKAGESNQRGHWAVAEYRLEKRWPMITSPTLLVWGGNELKRLDERGWDASQAVRGIAAAVPNSRRVVVPGVGVLFPNEAPEQFADLILEFLDS